MRQKNMDTPGVEDAVQQTARLSAPAEGSSAATLSREATRRTLSVAVLAAQCLGEIDKYRRGQPCDETYGLELVRRATIQGDQEAWAWMQHCFSGVVRGWLHSHPRRAVALRLESEEHYVAQAFEHFWQVTTLTQRVEYSRLSAALQYLHASLNGAILDTLRASARPREVPMPEPGAHGGPLLEELTSSSGVWEILQTVLPNAREQRLVYLLYHCGLSPSEIGHFCPQEWGDVQEIYRLRRTILERFLRHVITCDGGEASKVQAERGKRD
jgi:hypothetical protein